MPSQSADNTGCLIEHFGNAIRAAAAGAVLSRKAGIVRFVEGYMAEVSLRYEP